MTSNVLVGDNNKFDAYVFLNIFEYIKFRSKNFNNFNLCKNYVDWTFLDVIEHFWTFLNIFEYVQFNESFSKKFEHIQSSLAAISPLSLVM